MLAVPSVGRVSAPVLIGLGDGPVGEKGSELGCGSERAQLGLGNGVRRVY